MMARTEKAYLLYFPQSDRSGTLTTGRAGSVTFRIDRPEDEEEEDRQEFLDVVTFTSGRLKATQKVRWIEEDRVTRSADGVASSYVVLGRDNARLGSAPPSPFTTSTERDFARTRVRG